MSNERGYILVVSGPSGSGKSSVVKLFLQIKKDFDVAVSHTTRNKRAGEIEGRDYYFMDRDAFTAMIKKNEFVEWAEVYGNLYGTSRQELERILLSGKNVLLEIDVEGARNVKNMFGARVAAVFIVPESFEELKRRLCARNTDAEDVILKRINSAGKEFESIDSYDYVIINRKDGIQEAVNQLISVCASEELKTSRFWKYYKDIFWR